MGVVMPDAGTHCRSCGFAHPHGDECADCRNMHRLNRSKIRLVSFACHVCGEEHSIDVENEDQDYAIVSWLYHAGGGMA
jgi:hypothetical protein